ncbi:hypothetical protein X734_12790 [Mesorhizobium sp. L2C084A000]|nr:hypothetical protein X734_12790 [Mesorhizobium sp. L2C084A000]
MTPPRRRLARRWSASAKPTSACARGFRPPPRTPADRARSGPISASFSAAISASSSQPWHWARSRRSVAPSMSLPAVIAIRKFAWSTVASPKLPMPATTICRTGATRFVSARWTPA